MTGKSSSELLAELVGLIVNSMNVAATRACRSADTCVQLADILIKEKKNNRIIIYAQM